MKYIEEALRSPITGIKTDDFESMEKVGCRSVDLEVKKRYDLLIDV